MGSLIRKQNSPEVETLSKLVLLLATAGGSCIKDNPVNEMFIQLQSLRLSFQNILSHKNITAMTTGATISTYTCSFK
jgi:hypothetical protein